MSTADLSLPFPEDPWGPHRAAVTCRLETCADYLGRLQRSLTGQAAPDRLYFSTRAHDLFEAARDLVRLTEDIEHWLIVCDKRLVEVEPDGEIETRCELPRNHYAGHTSHPPEALAAQVRTSPHDLMDEAEAAARWVNKLGLLSDQRRAFEIRRSSTPSGTRSSTRWSRPVLGSSTGRITRRVCSTTWRTRCPKRSGTRWTATSTRTTSTKKVASSSPRLPRSRCHRLGGRGAWTCRCRWSSVAQIDHADELVVCPAGGLG